MQILQAAILGIVEGLTEFLPISSTFHLLFATQLLGIPTTAFSKFFDVFIQAGAILSVVFIFGKDWLHDRTLLKKVAVSFLPTALVGFILHDIIKNVFFTSNDLMIAAFILVGLIFFLLEWLIRKGKLSLTKPLEEVSYQHAVVIGFAQATAVLPGVSRAGAVMVMMMALGYRRDQAAKYSFILAVPTILAAAGFDLLKNHQELTMSNLTILPLLVGTVCSFVSAFFIIKWFIGFLQKHTLNFFGGYRVVLGLLLLITR